MVMSETVHVMPSGNCEVEMTLLPERQMKNIWTGVSVPTEHRQTTTDLSAISTEALFQYQIALFWHTECYRNFVSHSPLILKLMVSLFSVVTAMMAELVVLGSVNLKPRRLSALRKWTVHGVS